MSQPVGSAGHDDLVRRLRQIVIADAILAFAAGVFAVVMSLTVAKIGWLLAIGIFVALVGVSMLLALIPLRSGDLFRAVFIFAVANWIVAIVSTAVATFSWPLLMVTSLLPAVVAASFVTPDRLWWFVVPSFLTSLAVVAVGVLQDATGLSDRVPNGLKTGIHLVTAPGFGAVLVFVALQHHFTLSAALAHERQLRVDLDERAEELRRSRQRLVATTDRERRRIERDLHDGAQSRLVGVNLQLAAARAQLRHDPVAADEALDAVRQEVHRAHAELRDLAHGLYPSVLTQHGLIAALEAAADRSPTPVTIDLHAVGRLGPEVEAAIYFCMLEALQNVARHANATKAELRLWREGDAVVFEVVDDGVGIDLDRYDLHDAVGQGLTNLSDRLGAVGGELEVESTIGRGTTVRGRVAFEATTTG